MTNITKAKFSPANSMFYPQYMIDDGTFHADLPTDLIDITDAENTTYWRQMPPPGQVLGVIKGRPGWVDLPPPSAIDIAAKKAALTAQAKAKKTKLIGDASDEIDVLKDRIELGQDKADELKLWKSYRIALDDIDVSAPDINWPESPNVA
ncbi:caudovirales tail fiber assembly family protein [Yersinia pseudotuberculosis]|uniref:tail fiber assembly protein n=1 Tax=Yersinia pseudotuberculosis TaxID=633 RepID=UPI0001739815|nr:tail assembly chaperone [Yersinia pseudotuberculosis]CQD58417.1 tail assembly chaperone gp38 [Yersinia intermedia]AJJ01594.1 caudovirales tail fiber assembly family protein [Yersinia pseudotuberculosis]AJJ02290.1 caudovirales tail fiber assembly family protein [Yersinia pseudotuberculosis]AJJ66358.1 caudovirales tail fiber assembly family protein [Yersinia pseudotuberculosis PB1/+]AJJ72661.1 caudovirales tail fiber assembly family protein [Yersinia pseudotuberculosis]